MRSIAQETEPLHHIEFHSSRARGRVWLSGVLISLAAVFCVSTVYKPVHGNIVTDGAIGAVGILLAMFPIAVFPGRAIDPLRHYNLTHRGRELAAAIKWLAFNVLAIIICHAQIAYFFIRDLSREPSWMILVGISALVVTLSYSLPPLLFRAKAGSLTFRDFRVLREPLSKRVEKLLVFQFFVASLMFAIGTVLL